jgi:YegS/Rv2252/BmrU family lipid kinase
MSKRIARLILNPISGQGRGKKLLPEVVKRLEGLGYRADIVQTSKPGHARESAASAGEEDVALFVIFGGDGTISEVVNGLAGRPVPICVAPVGTANCLAKELNLGTHIEGLIRRIDAMQTRLIDSLLVNEKRALLFVGAGFDGEVGRKMAEGRSGHITELSYFLPVLRTLLTYHFPRFRVEIDGKEVESGATFVEVANVSTYGGPIVLSPDAKPDDGLLDVLIADTWRRGTMVEYLAQACIAKRVSGHNVRHLRGSEIALTANERVPVQVDGDFAGHLPVKIKVLPKSVCIVVDPE